MKLMKKILLVLVCIITLNYNYCVFGADINDEDNWDVGVALEDTTIASGDYSYIEDSSGLYLVGYTGNEETVYLPSELDGKTVVGIYTETFATCTNTKKIVIPETIEMIYEDSFINCRSLKEIEVAEGNDIYASNDGILYSKDYYYLVRAPEGKEGAVTVLDGTYYICDYAFFDCEKITSVHVPASVVGTDSNGDYGVGTGAFYGTKNLESITVDSKSKSYTVYDGVLYKLKNNTNTKEVLVKCPDTRTNCVTIPSTITEITDYAFYGCENLVGPINLPSNLKIIGESAFFNCKLLDGAINIPDTTTSIGKKAFYACESLEEITIGNGITEILDDSFGYCSSIKELTIPNTVTTIGERAFFYCTSIETLTLGTGLKNIGNWAFDYLKSLKGDLIIPDSVETIGIAAFMNATSIDGYIIIGKNVNQIDASAFYDSELAREIPAITESSFLKPDIPYYYLEGKVGFDTSVLAQKDLRIYNEKPVVEFIVDGQPYKEVTLDSYAMQVTSFANPIVDGYTFEGWYYDTSFTREYNFTDDVMANTKVYAMMKIINEITFEEEEITLEVGTEDSIKYTYILEDGITEQDIEWTSSNPDIATVDENGNIAALSKGEVTITATYKEASDSLKLIVWKDENKLEIAQDTLTLEIGEEYLVSCDYHFLDEATSENIIWESSDNEILSVENGKLVALKEGSATVTAAYADVSDTIVVVVLKNNSLDIKTEDTILKGKRSLDIEYEYYFNDEATSEDIVWTSSNANVAKVVNGKVTAALEGDAIITAVYKNVSDSVTITVVPEDSFEFNDETLKIENTITEYTLQYSWYSYDKTEQDIIWQSSNEEVATVENGVITINSCGETSITAICGDAADAILVKVVNPNTLNFANDSQLVRLEKDSEIIPEIEYYFNDNATYEDIIFESDNEEVIKIVDNKLIQVGVGVASITAKYGDVSDNISIEIILNDYIEFEKFGYLLSQGTEMTLPYEYYIYNQEENIIFTSSDENIVKVDEFGNVITLNEGEATITASYNEIEAKVIIVVKDNCRKGDLNLDGLVNSADAAIALKLYKYNNWTDKQRVLGDLNEDELINSADAAAILKIYKYEY